MIDLQSSYLEWLCVRAGFRKNSRLGRILHGISFVAYVDHDDNRVQDGSMLRLDYLEQHPYLVADHYFFNDPISVLEVLVALSERADDLACGLGIADDSQDWFDLMLCNLGINPRETYSKKYIVDSVERWVNRNYQPDGKGGVFPLRHPHQDQTQVELWYQLNFYIDENDLELGGLD